MIFISTIVKISTVLLVLLLTGGATYHLLYQSNEQTQTNNLKKHHQRTEHHSFLEEDSHLCHHGLFIKEIEIEEPLRPLEFPIEASLAHEQMLIKNHKQGNWQTIRIKSDYTYLQVTPEQRDFIEKKLLKASTGFLRAAIKIFPSLKLSVNGQCGAVTIPTAYKEGITDADLVLFIIASSSEQGWIARAASCRLDPITLRPTAGTMEFNLRYLNQLNQQQIDEGKWYKWIYTTIHETAHVLGFSPGLFPYFINPNTMQKLGIENVMKQQDGRNWIILPKVVDAVRSHFGCPTAWGAPLENSGGPGTAGSHWERVTFGNEAMTGSDFPDSVFTIFTFKLLESTGWYNMDHTQQQPYNWGKDEGCAIIQGQCSQDLREFCNTTEENCSSDFNGMAACSSKDILSDGCSYWRMYSNSDCRQVTDNTVKLLQYGAFFGNEGKCFLSTLPTKVGLKNFKEDCFKALCTNNVITFYVGNDSYQCSTTGQIINVKYQDYSATVTCPDVHYFCRAQRVCPKACGGVGTCRDTTCYCWDGFSGDDCSIIIS